MHIKNTTSLCPICLKPLDAEVYEEDGRVWIKKSGKMPFKLWYLF